MRKEEFDFLLLMHCLVVYNLYHLKYLFLEFFMVFIQVCILLWALMRLFFDKNSMHVIVFLVCCIYLLLHWFCQLP